mmetsp:Transcript_15448/g.37490  ORF Transcript_15448/g.37490 Transcript_15448/m.37490 type:complete len:237 (-) Transcript_15448:1131-1841(-)
MPRIASWYAFWPIPPTTPFLLRTPSIAVGSRLVERTGGTKRCSACTLSIVWSWRLGPFGTRFRPAATSLPLLSQPFGTVVTIGSTAPLSTMAFEYLLFISTLLAARPLTSALCISALAVLAKRLADTSAILSRRTSTSPLSSFLPPPHMTFSMRDSTMRSNSRFIVSIFLTSSARLAPVGPLAPSWSEPLGAGGGLSSILTISIALRMRGSSLMRTSFSFFLPPVALSFRGSTRVL